MSMMPNSLGRRARDSFSEDQREEAAKYLDTLVSAWKETSSTTTRKVVVIFALGAVFELLTGPLVLRSLNVGPLSFNNSVLLQGFIPAMVAYLLYDATCLAEECGDYRVIHSALVRKFQPSLYRNDMDLIVTPRVRGPWGFFARPPIRDDSLLSTGHQFELYFQAVATPFTCFIFPLAFEVQAYLSLFQRYGFEDASIWVSVVISTIFIVAWTIRIILSYREVRPLARLSASDRDGP